MSAQRGYIVLAGAFATPAERVAEIERLRAEGVATICGGCCVEYVGLWPAVCADCDGPLPDMPPNYRRTCSPDGRRVLRVERWTDTTIADVDHHWTFGLRATAGSVLDWPQREPTLEIAGRVGGALTLNGTEVAARVDATWPTGYGVSRQVL